MSKFVYRQNTVEAFQYQGEHLSALPKWVQDYRLKAPGAYGNSAVGTSITHQLLIPTYTGVIEVNKGDWVVMENDALFAARDSVFQRTFESSENPGTTEAAPVVENPTTVPEIVVHAAEKPTA